ncbi:hypothetical protein Poli38472_007176 [Pythium oligandrum]|uniref:FYVE-type domain-containing protein n=1 Tax=Pythium oligandrum TaxID=41045 RepID=A0A8K1C989_PYTOL|nr:hypothetical protein Poli38472_007176 [Pythium oligandrum]|eukprot:TMW59031.1 hypothetical protein Poli38472_007176 [Pythium oligandrum]
MSKFCPECGTAANGGKFCAECGTRFQENGAAAAPAQMAMPMPNVTPAQAAAAFSAVSNAASPVRNTWQSSTQLSYQIPSNGHTQQNHSPPPPPPVVPIATPVQSVGNPPHKHVWTATPAPTPAVSEVVPPAATGVEAQQVYEACVQTIRAARGGNNEEGVKNFKQNCRLYGLKQMDVQSFYTSLVNDLGTEGTLAFVPRLARLVPDDERRKELIAYNARQAPTGNANGSPHSPQVAVPYGSSSFTSRDSLSSAGSFAERSRSNSTPGVMPSQSSRGLLKGRYADHPNCDVCNVGFDVTKRRHQCRRCGIYVCSSCSPLRLLIPQGMEISGAKGYSPSEPQRVCLQCAPQLHQYQDQLVAQYAQANNENIHEARGRIHVPYSNSLFKECQNAADIVGNFFRDDWGSAKDRSIPVAFLQKAHGLAIMTIVKAGFLVSGQVGTGLVVAKLPDGTWSAPSAIGIAGLSGGFEVGGELVELMVVLGSEGAVKVFHKPQVNLGAGLDLTVGPYGRSAEVAAAASTSGLNANYSYSHSKGFFAGISLQGKVIVARNDLNRKFYGRDIQPMEILNGHVAAPNAARPLYEALGHAMQGVELHRETIARRASIMGPCRLCNCPMFVTHTHQVWNKNCKTCKHVH